MSVSKTPLLVFDWDGTLMDSISHIVDSLQYAMRETGIEVLGRERSSSIIGLGMREAIEALFPEQANDERFVRDYTRYYRDYYLDPARSTRLFPGVREMLTEFKEQGYTLAVATGKGRQGLDHVLQQTGLGALFSASRCAGETRSKPHPEMLQTILADTGFHRDQAIMIGDTEYDLEMASNAKVVSVGVSYGAHNEQQLIAHKPIAIIHKITELPELLQSQ